MYEVCVRSLAGISEGTTKDERVKGEEQGLNTRLK